MSSGKQLNGRDWPKDSEELLETFWAAATFHAGAVEVARDYADRLNTKAGYASNPISNVSQELAVDAEVFRDMAEDLIEVFVILSRRVRVTAEKARLNQLEEPNEVRRLKDRIKELHGKLYIECLEALGNGVDEAKAMADKIREDPEQTDRPQHLTELDDVIDDAENILNRERDYEGKFDNEQHDYSEEDRVDGHGV